MRGLYPVLLALLFLWCTWLTACYHFIVSY
jgi:hypothetical protein